MFVMPTSEELNDHERKTEVAEKPLADEAEPDEAVACHVCNMWLNGQEAYDVHLRGKRHRKMRRKQLAMERLDPSLGIGYEQA